MKPTNKGYEVLCLHHSIACGLISGTTLLTNFLHDCSNLSGSFGEFVDFSSSIKKIVVALEHSLVGQGKYSA